MNPKGRYKSWPHYLLAYAYRTYFRYQMKDLVTWDASPVLEDGCTAVLGMCHWLAEVLPANLRCLEAARWPELKEIIIVADTRKDLMPADHEDKVRAMFPNLRLRFAYYNEKQHHFAQKVKLPYVFAWMSWAIGLNLSRTKVAFIQDYDALVLGNVLAKRYQLFVEQKTLMQGVKWYFVNGIAPEDRLASTFEAFVDVEWVRKFPPIKMFNRVGRLNGRGVDFDILLEMQAKHAPLEKRAIVEMGLDELVHPTQMIHQYTHYKKNPGSVWYCAATVMIPFFYYLSGNKTILRSAAASLRQHENKNVALLGDDCKINFTTFVIDDVEWMMKQMVQVCVRLGIEPFYDLYDYGNAQLEICQSPKPETWTKGFDTAQLEWVAKAAASKPS